LVAAVGFHCWKYSVYYWDTIGYLWLLFSIV
jgi:hypothetical protein